MGNIESLEYFVREDITSSRQTQIHKKNCNFVKNYRKIVSRSSIWHGPFTKTQAILVAKQISKNYATGWGNAGCCILPRLRRANNKHKRVDFDYCRFNI